MDTAWILKYLTGLNEHNNGEWYNAHKAETKEATEQFEELVQALILRIGEFDSSVLHIQPKDTAFTLNIGFQSYNWSFGLICRNEDLLRQNGGSYE